MFLPPAIDQGTLTHAATLAAGFSFGAVEMWFENFPSKYKPVLYIALTTFLTLVSYVALASTNPWIQLLVATVGIATTVTGGVSFTQNNVLPAISGTGDGTAKPAAPVAAGA